MEIPKENEEHEEQLADFSMMEEPTTHAYVDLRSAHRLTRSALRVHAYLGALCPPPYAYAIDQSACARVLGMSRPTVAAALSALEACALLEIVERGAGRVVVRLKGRRPAE